MTAHAQEPAPSVEPDQAPGIIADQPVSTPMVVFCLVPDYGSQKFFYAPLHTISSVSPGTINRLSARFVRAVNAQQAADLSLSPHVCAASPSTRVAARSLYGLMTPLLNQGYVGVPIGVY